MFSLIELDKFLVKLSSGSLFSLLFLLSVLTIVLSSVDFSSLWFPEDIGFSAFFSFAFTFEFCKSIILSFTLYCKDSLEPRLSSIVSSYKLYSISFKGEVVTKDLIKSEFTNTKGFVLSKSSIFCFVFNSLFLISDKSIYFNFFSSNIYINLSIASFSDLFDAKYSFLISSYFI